MSWPAEVASLLVGGLPDAGEGLRRRLAPTRDVAAFDAYLARREGTRVAAAAYDQQALQGKLDIIYNFGNDMIDDQAISITTEEVKVPGFDQPLVFKKDERYSDMLD